MKVLWQEFITCSCCASLPTAVQISVSARRHTPIHTSPNCPLPRRLMSCSDSRGISHTSLVLTDRSVRRGMPLWQGAISRQHSPAALAGEEKWQWVTKTHTPKKKKKNTESCRKMMQSHRSSAEQAVVGSQTGPWWWCSTLRCPVCGSYSVWRDLLWCRPSLGWTENKPLQARKRNNLHS